jgi:SHS2 domain-containing protein
MTSDIQPLPPYQELDHTADLALLVRGADLEALLRHAALGMYHLMGADIPPAGPGIRQRVVLSAMDAEDLLVDWLGELAFWAESRQLIFRAFTFHDLSPGHLTATLQGGRVGHLEKHIKAVTFHNLRIVDTPQGLETTIVFDV